MLSEEEEEEEDLAITSAIRSFGLFIPKTFLNFEIMLFFFLIPSNSSFPDLFDSNSCFIDIFLFFLILLF